MKKEWKPNIHGSNLPHCTFLCCANSAVDGCSYDLCVTVIFIIVAHVIVILTDAFNRIDRIVGDESRNVELNYELDEDVLMTFFS